MKLRILLLCLMILPNLAMAEIYKWKDKEGVTRYSDVPPPSNVKQEMMQGKKTPKPTGLAPLTEVEGDATALMNKEKATSGSAKEKAAAKRAKDAEASKQEDEAKQAELKLKQENCKVAKSNLATYTNGGRITKTDESGERTYLGDKDIAAGKADAQRDVEKYCD
ncbi:MAG: DUF4124 domain-containing protein [Methylotenera sp.]|nr:DUF4124 domain-containing protein [Methylotenera sp.]